jgi:hypothetical protein
MVVLKCTVCADAGGAGTKALESTSVSEAHINRVFTTNAGFGKAPNRACGVGGPLSASERAAGCGGRLTTDLSDNLYAAKFSGDTVTVYVQGALSLG